MPATKAKRPKKPGKPKKIGGLPAPDAPAAAGDRLRIRMYRHGLGDCFLLTFHRKIHVLIDCGVIVGTRNPEPLMTRVVDDIRRTTGGRVDVLVVTHEHWDHVSGFSQARAAFDRLEFEQVWMAWTEDPANELANRLRAEREAKKRALRVAATHLARSPDSALARLGAGVSQVLGFAGIALGAADGSGGDTGEAMEYARQRGLNPGSSLRLLPPGKSPFLLPGTQDVRVFVLGPPEDERLLKRSDPSKAHSEVYLTPSVAFLAGLDPVGTSPEDQSAAFPFAESVRCPAPAGQPGPDVPAALADLLRSGYLAPDQAYRTIESDWLAGAGTLALQLDSDTNNTSLVLAFEFVDTGEVFLFPGDAQVGNWLSWDKYEWTVDDPRGRPHTVKAADLLARTLFYKVGHHGSHNATLRELGLERMTHPDLVAMVPVNQEMARKKRWKMPWPNLRRRLEEKCASLIVQDEAEQAARPRRGRVEVAPAEGSLPSLWVDSLL